MNLTERFDQLNDVGMSGEVVVQLLQLFDQQDIEVIVDSGWGVDTLLKEQTCFHGDLDIALQQKDVPKLRALLESRGYYVVPRDDTCDCNFVMGDGQGTRSISIPSTFDAHGKLIFGVAYSLESLTGTGSIQSYSAKYISAEWMVKFHSGYELDETIIVMFLSCVSDLELLCQRSMSAFFEKALGKPLEERFLWFYSSLPTLLRSFKLLL